MSDARDASALERAEKPPLAQRVDCPFYGRFINAVPQLARTFPESNQCALMTGEKSSCALELAGIDPDWWRCHRNPANNGSGNPIPDTPESVAEKAKGARAFGEMFEALGRTETR